MRHEIPGILPGEFAVGDTPSGNGVGIPPAGHPIDSLETSEVSAPNDSSAAARESAGPRRVAALIRHGHFPRPEDTASGHLIHPLSDEGRRQARDAAPGVVDAASELGLELDPVIEASRLLRASQTARILAETLHERTGRDFEVEDRDELLERGLGSCTNLRFDQIEALLELDPRLDVLPRGWRRIPDFRLPVPGAESLIEAGHRTADRIDESLRSIPPDAPDCARLFVAHSGCLRHAAVVRDVVPIDAVSRLTMDFTQVVWIERLRDGTWVKLRGDWSVRDRDAEGGRPSRANEAPER